MLGLGGPVAGASQRLGTYREQFRHTALGVLGLVRRLVQNGHVATIRNRAPQRVRRIRTVSRGISWCPCTETRGRGASALRKGVRLLSGSDKREPGASYERCATAGGGSCPVPPYGPGTRRDGGRTRRGAGLPCTPNAGGCGPPRTACAGGVSSRRRS
ncbi:predicted protein [Streptomyces sp. SPB78]|nr:predicted protein [Streptomyces sp. SPB78]